MADTAGRPALGWRWALVLARLAAMLALLALAVPLHLILRALGRHRVVPPRFLQGIGWIAGLRVRAEGRPAAGRLLLVANHVSWLDIFGLAGASGCAFVAKGDLAGNSVLRWLCEQNETLFVMRDRRGGAGTQVEQVRSALSARRMTIFPEGTTSDGTALLPFKSALLAAVEEDAANVQPVALDYREAPGIAWFGNEPALANVLRVLARVRPVRLNVRFLQPLTAEERAGRKAMAAAAQQRIAGALGVPALPKTGPIA